MSENKFLNIQTLSRRKINFIFSKINIDTSTGCWIWNGALGGAGYGQVRYNGKMEYTHRVIFSWLISPIPIGKNVPQIDHLCNNYKCCNPIHLKLTSHKENVLRGNSIPSINARKTRCLNGHPFSPKLDANGKRICNICASKRKTKYRQKKRELQYITKSFPLIPLPVKTR